MHLYNTLDQGSTYVTYQTRVRLSRPPKLDEAVMNKQDNHGIHIHVEAFIRGYRMAQSHPDT